MRNKFSIFFYNLELLLKYLFRRKFIIILTVLIGCLCGLGFALLKKVRYEAGITFALDESNDNLGGALSLVADFGFNVGSNKGVFSGDNILQIITSRRIVESALLSSDTFPEGKQQLNTYAGYYLELIRKSKSNSPSKEARMESVQFLVNKDRSQFTYLEDSVLFVLYKDHFLPNIEATKPDKKFGIYQVTFKGPEERFALRFTKKLLDLTKEFYTELKSKKSRQTLAVLENRVASMKGSMNSAIEKKAGFQDANRNPSFLGAEVPIQKNQADISVYGAAYTELFKNLEIARFQYLKNVPLLEIIDDVNYPLKRVKRSRLIMGISFGMVFGFLTVLFLSAVYYLKNGFENIRPEKPVSRAFSNPTK